MGDECLQLAELVKMLALRLRGHARMLRGLLARLELELESACAEGGHGEGSSTLFMRFKDHAERIARLRGEAGDCELAAEILESLVPHASRSCGGLLEFGGKLKRVTREGTDIGEVRRIAQDLIRKMVGGSGEKIGAHEPSAYDVFEELCVRRLRRRRF